MESITLSIKTLQRILNYLATQPYNEVVNLINTIPGRYSKSTI